MKKADPFKDTVEQLVSALGGIDNIKSAEHCATRFRVYVNDDNKVNKELLSKVDKSKGYSKEGDQWQIIFGAGIVNRVFDKYSNLYSNQNLAKGVGISLKNTKWKWDYNYSLKINLFSMFRSGVRGFASIFIPLIPLFVAGGLSLAINSLIVAKGIGKDADGNFINSSADIASQIFNTIGGSILGSLPVFIGFLASKKWGGNPWFGAAVGLIIITPNFISTWSQGNANIHYYVLGTIVPPKDSPDTWIPILWDNGVRAFGFPIFGIPLMGYQAQIIPILLIIAILVQIEKLMRKISPESIAIISVPLVSIVLASVLAFAIIGPVGYVISLAIAEALKAIFIYTNFPGFGLGGAILGAVYAPIVITGLHQGFLPVEATLISQFGESWITPIASVSNVAQGMACLAGSIFIIDKKLKGTAYSGALSANLGITEPAMFGVNINLRHLFLAAMIGSAFGGYYVGMTQNVANSLGSASWLGLIQFDVTRTDNLNRWYESVSSLTPWGNYMNGFGLVPIINQAIALTISSVVAFLTSALLSLAKYGQDNLKDVNGDLKNYKFVKKFSDHIINFQNKISNFFFRFFLTKKAQNKKTNKQNFYFIYAPVSGTLKFNNLINDYVFANNLMGQSAMIEVDNNVYKINSLVNKGKISSIFPTGHALTISQKNQNQILLHIGLDTSLVNLEPKNLRHLKGIKYKKFILSKINKKTNILEVDQQVLKANGAKSTALYLAVLKESLKDQQKIEILANPGYINCGDPIFKVSLK